LVKTGYCSWVIKASVPRWRGNTATGGPTEKQRIRALILGAPPSLVALTDRFRSITPPTLSASVNSNKDGE